MKNQLIVLLLFLGMINASAQISKAEIMATGLTCSMCSNAINKQLKAMPEVEKVNIDLNTNTFEVVFKKNAAITPLVLKNSIEKTGFFVGSMILTIEGNTVEPKDNGSFKNASGTYVFVTPKASASKGSLRLKILNNGFVTKKEFKQSSKLLSKYQGFGAQEGTYLVKTI